MTDEKIEYLNLDLLHPFENNPFQSVDESEYDELRDSVKEFGIITPLIVNKSDNGYEIISGHRRWQIAKELNLDVVPVYVREFSKEEAVINFVDCNLSREKILPSEKARAYKMKHDAIKKQGARTDLTSSQVGTKFRSDEKLAETMPDSRMQIQRYIRLNNLQPALLDNNEQRADYSEALLACSVNRRMIAACPLAFGEVGVKDRIKSVLNYKKPAFWIIIVAVIASITVAVCFLTNPVNSSVYNSRYETGKCLYSYVVSADKETKSNELVFDIASDGKVYKIFGDGTTDELGVLKESDYTAEELEAAIKNQDAKLNIGNIKNAYELSDCIFLQKSNGTVYLVQFFSDGRIMSVFKLNRIDKSDIQNGSYKLSEEIYFNGSYSYVPNFENDRIEISTNGGMHIYHFIGEELSTGARYEEIKLNKENFSALFDNAEIWSDNKNHKVLLKNNKKAWYHKTPDDMGGYPYMLLLQKDGTLCMIFADFENGEPTRIRYVYELGYIGSIEGGNNKVDNSSTEHYDLGYSLQVVVET